MDKRVVIGKRLITFQGKYVKHIDIINPDTIIGDIIYKSTYNYLYLNSYYLEQKNTQVNWGDGDIQTYSSVATKIYPDDGPPIDCFSSVGYKNYSSSIERTIQYNNLSDKLYSIEIQRAYDIALNINNNNNIQQFSLLYCASGCSLNNLPNLKKLILYNNTFNQLPDLTSNINLYRIYIDSNTNIKTLDLSTYTSLTRIDIVNQTLTNYILPTSIEYLRFNNIKGNTININSLTNLKTLKFEYASSGVSINTNFNNLVNLENLYVMSNPANCNLSVINNPKLKLLNIHNYIGSNSIDLTSCHDLTDLTIQNASLSNPLNLNLAGITGLTNLMLWGSGIVVNPSQIELNTNLKYAVFYNGTYSSFNFWNCNKLTNLNIFNVNNLTLPNSDLRSTNLRSIGNVLDFSPYSINSLNLDDLTVSILNPTSALSYIYFYNVTFNDTTLDISMCNNLSNCFLYNLNIDNIIFPNTDNSSFYPQISQTQIYSLTIPDKMINISCGQNSNLSSIDLSSAYNLRSINSVYSMLSSVDLSNCGSLESVDFSYNSISSINLTTTGLTNLTLSFNNLSSFDFSHLTSLQYCYINNNQLTSADFSMLNDVQDIDISNNYITDFSINCNANLYSINACYNPLDITFNLNNLINIQNGASINVSYSNLQSAKLDELISTFWDYRYDTYLNVYFDGISNYPSGTYDDVTDWIDGIPQTPAAKLYDIINNIGWYITQTWY